MDTIAQPQQQAQPTETPWSAIEGNAKYQKSSPQIQDQVKESYYNDVMSKRPDFQGLADNDKQYVHDQFINEDSQNAQKLYDANQSPAFVKQMAAGMQEHLPYGKDLALAIDPKAANMTSRTPAPKTWDEKLGRFIGAGLGILPAWEAGSAAAGALVGPAVEGATGIASTAINSGDTLAIARAAQLAQKAKGLEGTAQLAGGAAAAGSQGGVESKTEGATAGQAITQGALDAGTMFVGGKVLEAAGGAIANAPANIKWTASKINDSVIKPQLKDLKFGRDPGGFLAREVTSPDNSLHGWKAATDAVVDQKVQQAKEIVAGKADQTVNVKDAIDKVYNPAMDEAARTGNDSLLQQLVKDKQTLENKQIVTKDPVTGEVKIGSAGQRDLTQCPLADAIDLKRTIGKMPTNWTQGNETLSSLMSARRQAYGAVRAATEQVAPELGPVNSDIADGISASKAMERQMGIQQRQWMAGLYDISGGGLVVHGLVTGNLGTLAAGLSTLGVNNVMKSPYIMSRIAAVLSKVGNGVEKQQLMQAVPWLQQKYGQIMDSLKNMTPETAFGTSGKVDAQEVENNALRPDLSANKAPVTDEQQMLKDARESQGRLGEGGKASTGLIAGSATATATGLASSKSSAQQPTKEDAKYLSLSGQARTAQEEGFRPNVYTDTRGFKTVGTGFNLDSPTMKALVPLEVQQGKRGLTQQENSRIFNVAYRNAQTKAVNFAGTRTWNMMNEKQRSVLTDMSYNLGSGALNKFHQLKIALQNGNWDNASKQILNSNYAKQVPNRARRNAALMKGFS